MKVDMTNVVRLRRGKESKKRREGRISEQERNDRLFWLDYHLSTMKVEADLSDMGTVTGYQLLKSVDKPGLWMFVSWRGYISEFNSYKAIRAEMKQEYESHQD